MRKNDEICENPRKSTKILDEYPTKINEKSRFEHVQVTLLKINLIFRSGTLHSLHRCDTHVGVALCCVVSEGKGDGAMGQWGKRAMGALQGGDGGATKISQIPVSEDVFAPSADILWIFNFETKINRIHLNSSESLRSPFHLNFDELHTSSNTLHHCSTALYTSQNTQSTIR